MNTFSRIVVQCNINHSVNSANPDDGTEEAPEMKSRPNFEVDIVKSDGTTLSFSCGFIHEHDMDQEAAKQEGYGNQLVIIYYLLSHIELYKVGMSSQKLGLRFLK